MCRGRNRRHAVRLRAARSAVSRKISKMDSSLTFQCFFMFSFFSFSSSWLSSQWRLDWFPVAEAVFCVGLQGAPVLLLVRWAAKRRAPQGQDKGRPLVSTCNIHSDMLEPKLILQCSWILLVYLDKLQCQKFSTRHSTKLPISYLLVVSHKWPLKTKEEDQVKREASDMSESEFVQSLKSLNCA